MENMTRNVNDVLRDSLALPVADRYWLAFLIAESLGYILIRMEERKTIARALIHDGIEVDEISDKAKAELLEAVEVLLTAHSRS